MSISKEECDNCEYNGKLNAEKLNICKSCFKLEPQILITQTDCIKTYPIGKAELQDIRYVEVRSGWSRNKFAYLFLIKDIKHHLMLKYGGVRGYENAQKIRVEKSEERKRKKEENNRIAVDKKNAEMEEYRRLHPPPPPPKINMGKERELSTHLKSIGLEKGIRRDSMLCRNYIYDGYESLTKEEIGKTMIEMEFFHLNTEYKNILKKMRKNNSRYNREWDDWECCISEEELRDEAKQKSIENYMTKHKNRYTHQDDIADFFKRIKIPLSLHKKGIKQFRKLANQHNKKNKTI
jgi:hypothetical protein